MFYVSYRRNSHFSSLLACLLPPSRWAFSKSRQLPRHATLELLCQIQGVHFYNFFHWFLLPRPNLWNSFSPFFFLYPDRITQNWVGKEFHLHLERMRLYRYCFFLFCGMKSFYQSFTISTNWPVVYELEPFSCVFLRKTCIHVNLKRNKRKM